MIKCLVCHLVLLSLYSFWANLFILLCDNNTLSNPLLCSLLLFSQTITLLLKILGNWSSLDLEIRHNKSFTCQLKRSQWSFNTWMNYSLLLTLTTIIGEVKNVCGSWHRAKTKLLSFLIYCRIFYSKVVFAMYIIVFYWFNDLTNRKLACTTTVLPERKNRREHLCVATDNPISCINCLRIKADVTLGHNKGTCLLRMIFAWHTCTITS